MDPQATGLAVGAAFWAVIFAGAFLLIWWREK